MPLAMALLIIGLFSAPCGVDCLIYATTLTGLSFVIVSLIVETEVVSLCTLRPEFTGSVAGTLHRQLPLCADNASGTNSINTLLTVTLSMVLHFCTAHFNDLRHKLSSWLPLNIDAGSLSSNGVLYRSDKIMTFVMFAFCLRYLIYVACRAPGQKSDKLTREQVARLCRDSSLPAAYLWLRLASITSMVARQGPSSEYEPGCGIWGLSATATGISLMELAAAGARMSANEVAISSSVGINPFNLTPVAGCATPRASRRFEYAGYGKRRPDRMGRKHDIRPATLAAPARCCPLDGRHLAQIVLSSGC